MAHPALRLLQIHNANEAAFGVEEASFTARAIKAVVDPKWDVAQASDDDPTIRTRLEQAYVKRLGLKNATKVTFSTPLRGTGTAAGSAVQAKGAVDLAEGQLLKNAFGGETLGTGTTINDETPTTTGFTVTSAAGLGVGQAVAVTVGTVIEANVIASKDGNDLTFVRAFSAAPSNGAVVYAAATYYPAALSGSLQLQCLGAEDPYYRLLGCQANCKLAGLAQGSRGTISWDVMAASWTKKTGASLAIPTFDNTQLAPIAGQASALYVQDRGTTTRNLVNASAIDVDPGLSPVAVPSVSGVEGVQAYVAGVPTPKVKLTLNAFSGDWIDDWASQQAAYLHYQIGATAGNIVLIELQNATLDGPPARASVANNHLGHSLELTGRGYGTTETDLVRAPIRLHLL